MNPIKHVLISFILLFSSADSIAFNAQNILHQASRYYGQGDYKQAEKAFEQLLNRKLNLHPEFYYFYGKTLYYNTHYEKAITSLKHFIANIEQPNKYFTDAERILKRAEKAYTQQTGKQAAQAQGVLTKKNIPQMIVIRSGSFLMGSNHGSMDQKPLHKITTLQDFAIGKYEVSFAQYDEFADATIRKKPDDSGWGRGQRPVINVSFYDAYEYARWLSRQTHRKFRLPTEAEWEYVARSGLIGQLGFKNLLGLGDANCDGCRYFWQSAQTVEVGNFAANKYDVYDLFGNVWEWTCSIYTRRYTGEEKYCVNKNELLGKTMVVRGGGWNSNNAILRSYVRLNNFPAYFGNELGFRLVEELD